MKAAEQLNELLVAAEQTFMSIGLRTPAWIKLDDTSSLVWQKDGAAWHFFIRYFSSGDLKRLSAASLRLRAAAAKALPDMRTAILRAEEQLTSEVEEAVDLGSAFLATMNVDESDTSSEEVK